MKTVVVTGATGFVGTALTRMAVRAGLRVLALSSCGERATTWHDTLPSDVRSGVRMRLRTEPWSTDHWARGASALIHLAARVHVMEETATDPDAAFQEINVHGTRNAFAGSAEAGIRRFVFVSSVKVQGEVSPAGGFGEDLALRPSDAYARSKMLGEHAVRAMSVDHHIPFVIVRPPLVYGAGAGGNMAKLVSWISRDRPVPVGAAQGRRSLIGVRNLADVLLRCAVDPRAEGRTFLVADGEPVTVPELVRTIGDAMDRHGTSFMLPTLLQRLLALVPTARARLERLSAPLVVNDQLVRRTLDWVPPYTMREELREMMMPMQQRGGAS